jgi:hypothetical protein
VGGWAVGIYGNPRATKDIDFLVATDDENLEKLERTLLEFGAPPVDLKHFKEKGNVIRMGSSPVQIDIINEATGIEIRECYSRRQKIKVEDIEIALISKEDLVKNKRASGRARDLADAENLEGKDG